MDEPINKLSEELRILYNKRNKCNFPSSEHQDLSAIIFTKSELLVKLLKKKDKYRTVFVCIQGNQLKLNKEDTLKYFLNNPSVYAYINKFKKDGIYGIIIIIGEWTDDCWNMIHRRVIYTLFIDEGGVDIAKNDLNERNIGMLMPPNFYTFAQSLCLDLDYIYNLYRLNRICKYQQIKVNYIIEREGYWPLITNNKEKL